MTLAGALHLQLVDSLFIAEWVTSAPVLLRHQRLWPPVSAVACPASVAAYCGGRAAEDGEQVAPRLMGTKWNCLSQ